MGQGPSLGQMFGANAGEAAQFMGLKSGRIEALEADIAVFGADCATPYGLVGAYCAGGPAAMRAGAADFAGGFDKVNFDIGTQVLPDGVRACDLGDLPTDSTDAEGNRARIRDMTARIVGSGAIPILLGGDDSVPIPMLQGLAAVGPLTILQVDAHIDWRDSVNGERWGLSSTMRRASEMAHVARIVQVGARGIGSARMADLQAARDWGAEVIPMHDFSRLGRDVVLDCIPKGGQVAICFDCDALDPSIMPAVIAPTAGGLSYGDALGLVRGVAERARIAAFALVEFMPDRDRDGEGARVAGQIVAAVLGLVAQQVAEAQTA
ncbi:MAG: arginase family protein [Pseudomonadota bacterium]